MNSLKLQRRFQIWGYTAGHSVLILRSVDGVNLGAPNNLSIDIEFCGVSYIEMPDFLNIEEIASLELNIPERFVRYEKLEYMIFSIIDKDHVHYVIAAGCIIGKHQWMNESRISNPNLNYQEIIYRFK